MEEVNTFNNTVIKDWVENGAIETELRLSEEDMKNIYRKLGKLDLNDKEKELECQTEPENISSWENPMGR